jgi:hypothetical protein
VCPNSSVLNGRIIVPSAIPIVARYDRHPSPLMRNRNAYANAPVSADGMPAIRSVSRYFVRLNADHVSTSSPVALNA